MGKEHCVDLKGVYLVDQGLFVNAYHGVINPSICFVQDSLGNIIIGDVIYLWLQTTFLNLCYIKIYTLVDSEGRKNPEGELFIC